MKNRESTTSTKMMIMIMIMCLLLSLSLSVSSRQQQRPQPFVSALYVLGDSSVDCGDNSVFYALNHRNFSLTPCDNGSDSSLLPHFLAKQMGLPDILRVNSQNGSIDKIEGGVNYGSAQATIMKPTINNGFQSLNQQLRQLSETFQLLQLRLGEENSRHSIGSSVVYLSFGKDDYINMFLRNESGIMLKYSGQNFAHILVDQMVVAMKNLYDANVQKVICMGILPLGCMPRIVSEWKNTAAVDDSRGCVEEVNELALQFNTLLIERVLELNVELDGIDIIFCDGYQGIMQILSAPEKHGIKDTKNACCGLGLHGASIGCLSPQMACKEAAAHLWWDLYNPSRAVNSLLADSAWSGLPFSICHPFNINDLVSTTLSHLN
ncbi:hypothetical protein ACFE04_015454 [Oxalis oulophora]